MSEAVRTLAGAGGILLLAVSLATRARAQDLSFSTDFDGRGTGSGFTVHIETPPTPPAESAEAPPPAHFTPRPGQRPAPRPQARMSSYLQQRFQQQVQDAQRAAQEEQLRQQAAEAQRRNDLTTLQQLTEQLQALENNEPNYQRRMALTQQVLDLEPQLARAESDYLATLPSYRERLSASIGHIVVPPPPHPLHYQRLLIWGAMSSPEEAQQATRAGVIDPFTGAPFDQVFAFGSAQPYDLARAGLDHLLSSFGALSPETDAEVAGLRGASADELVCHSNGCLVAEVLIATGELKVTHLRMLGGDTSLWQLGYLNTLAQEHGVQDISVNVIEGDRVPMVDPGWKVMDLMRQIGTPLETYINKASDPLYQYLGLTPRAGFNPDARVQVHTLSYPAESDLHPLDKHEYETYDRVVTGWRLSGCLAPGGATNPHCMIYQ